LSQAMSSIRRAPLHRRGAWPKSTARELC
jgi:hypothetical protein